MADEKKLSVKCSTQLSSEPETDARPFSPESSLSVVLGGQSDRNHPSGAIPRTQQGSVQHDRSFTSYEDSGIHRSEEYSQTGSSSSSRSKICPSGHESITYNSSGQKTPSDDELISRYLEELEDETLKVGYFDVMIIYCEEDREKAEAYKDHLNNDIITKSGKCIKAVLFDDAELESLAGSKFAHLEKAFERCTFAFVYLTKEFCENDDGWCRVSSEECLMKAIYDKEKKWCVVPVYTVQRNKANFKIPMGLNALKGINYYNNDEFYRRGLTKLLESKLFVRQNNEKNHREKILQEIKNHIMKLKEREHKIFLNRQISEREARQQEERHQQQIKAMTQQNHGSHRYALSSSSVYTELLQDQAQDPSTLKQQESFTEKSFDNDESLENLRDALEHSEINTSRHNEGSSSEDGLESRSIVPDSPDSQLTSVTAGLGKSQIASYVPKTHFLPGQHKPIQHAPGQHLPIKNQPGQQHVMSQHPYPNKSGKQREIVEIHHHHHYTSPPEEADYKSSRKVVNVIGAKYVQIGKGGNVVSAEGGRTVEGDESDKDSSSDSEQQAPAKKGQRGADESIPSADGCSTTQENLSKKQDNDHNDKNQTDVKTVDEITTEKIPTVGVVTAKQMPGKNSTNNMPEKSFDSLSLGSMMSDKSQIPPRERKIKPFLVNKMEMSRPVVSVPPMQKVSPKNDGMENLFNNVINSSNDRELEDPTDYINSLKSQRNQTYTGERELSDETNEKVTYKSGEETSAKNFTEDSEETDIKRIARDSEVTEIKQFAKDNEVTEIKQFYSKPKQDRDMQGHTAFVTAKQVKPVQLSVTSGNHGQSGKIQISNISASNYTAESLKNSGHLDKSLTNKNISPPNSNEDPDETEVLKPASNNRLSRDLDMDCGDFESLPSSINSSSEFIILQSYSETLTEEDKELNAVKQVLDMGCDEKDVKRCLNQLKRRNPGRKHFSVPDLVELLFPCEGQQSPVHKSATDTMLSKKSDLPSRQMSSQPTSSSDHSSGSTKDKCCVS